MIITKSSKFEVYRQVDESQCSVSMQTSTQQNIDTFYPNLSPLSRWESTFYVWCNLSLGLGSSQSVFLFSHGKCAHSCSRGYMINTVFLQSQSGVSLNNSTSSSSSTPWLDADHVIVDPFVAVEQIQMDLRHLKNVLKNLSPIHTGHATQCINLIAHCSSHSLAQCNVSPYTQWNCGSLMQCLDDTLHAQC